MNLINLYNEIVHAQAKELYRVAKVLGETLAEKRSALEDIVDLAYKMLYRSEVK